MNERLKELMLEAGYTSAEIDGRTQKLAELIVKECVGTLSKDLQDICATTYDYGLKDAILDRQSKNISEYFSITYKGVAPKQHI